MAAIGFKKFGTKRASKYAGTGVIGDAQTGLVTEDVDKTPVKREIVLVDAVTKQPVDVTWSNEQGQYQFTSLNTGLRYDVYTRDHTQKWQMAGHSDVVPVDV